MSTRCIGETPIDRLADAPAVVPPTAPSPPATAAARPRPGSLDRGAVGASAARLAMPRERDFDPRAEPANASAPSPDAAIMAAREAAQTAASLDELRAILDRFEGCALKATATQLVFADGNPQARVMFVGEAPGRDEDLAGLPFVGRSGKLLDRMLAAIGLDRTQRLYRQRRTVATAGQPHPTPQESAICVPFIRRQIELADPEVLVCMGNPSTQILLATKDGITKTRGRWFAFHTGTREIRAIATYHPAFLLRSPLQKRLAWRDFLAVKKALATS